MPTPTVWVSLKKTLHCKPDPSQVHDPKSKKHLATFLTRKPGRSGCSRSIANLKDVILIHGGNKGHSQMPVNCSPRSIGSSEFINPIAHEVIFSDSKCELKITGFNGGGGGGDGSGVVGTLRPGTPGPGGGLAMHNFKNQEKSSRKTVFSKPLLSASNGSSAAVEVTCHKCGKQFGKLENLEAHHLSMHAGKFLFKLSFFSLSRFNLYAVRFIFTGSSHKMVFIIAKILNTNLVFLVVTEVKGLMKKDSVFMLLNSHFLI